jgi:hypothetical protein
MDLLLIIVFAQYLEFHRSSAESRAKTEHEIAEARQSLEVQLDRKTQELDQVRNRLILDNQQLRQQTDTAVAMTEEAQRRQALTEELLRKLLQVDADLIDAELSPPEAVDALRDTEATAKTIRNADGANLLRFLAGYDELLKRAEVWTIHVSDRGDTEIKAGGNGGKSYSFRLEEVSQVSRTEEFVQQMRAAHSQIPQPKGLVVILVSFSPRAIAGNYQPVLDGMPRVIEWLGKDSGGRTRFEYAVIGAITDPNRDLPIDDGPQ